MRTVYMCEKCGKIYDTNAEAVYCETTHNEALLIKFSYEPGNRYPNMIECKFDDFTRRYFAPGSVALGQ